MKNKRVINHIDLLKLVSSCKKCMRNNLIKSGSKEFVASICECADNLLNNNIPVTEEDKQNLHKYKGALRKLIKKSNLDKKKKILIQQGGFLQYLIPAAISTIASLLGNAFSSQ